MGCGDSKPSNVFHAIQDHYKTLEEVQEALRKAGLESSNCTLKNPIFTTEIPLNILRFVLQDRQRSANNYLIQNYYTVNDRVSCALKCIAPPLQLQRRCDAF
jgi:hypothetical protein